MAKPSDARHGGAVMQRLDLNGFRSDRILGFTVPRNGVFQICDHDEVWRVVIGASAEADVTDDAPYEFSQQSPDFIPEGSNRPLLQAGQARLDYKFKRGDDFATVRYSSPITSGEIKFRTFSGDWFVASLSDDGRHLILAEPYDLAIYALD